MKLAGAISVALVGVLVRSTAPNDTWAVGRQIAVVTAEPHATQVGLEVLAKGGNAVDAAVAVALALAVTHPQAGNLGGGGFMLIRLADGTCAALDFRETAPGAAHRDMYLREDGSVDPELGQLGATAAGVPGSPAGLLAALERFGTRPLDELAAPAITLARDGFEVTHFLASSLRAGRQRLGRFESSRGVFFAGDRPLRAGATLRQPDLAATLERLVEGGFDGFYRGRTAELIVAEIERGGAEMTLDDLAAYEAVWREPIRGSYRGREILSMPPPSSGGIALLQMLGMLQAYDLRASGLNSARTVHLLSEAMRRAYADRARWLGDADHWPVPVDGLVSEGYVDSLRATIRDDRVTEVAPGRPPGAPKEGGDTTHFSIVDAAGNAVACTTTINSTFGSGLVVGGAGFLLNNEMDDFSAKPGVPNQFGLVGAEANAIAPHKRMLSSMTPTIVLEDGELRWVLGAPGGGRIITGVLQVLLNVVDHELPLREAVAAPRVHHQWRPEHLVWERTALSADTRAALEERGHLLAPRPGSIARVQAIEVRADGTRVAVADPRSGGAAAAK